MQCAIDICTPNAPLIEMQLPGELLLESTSQGPRWCVGDLLGSTSSENIRRSLPMCSKYRFFHPETPDFTAAPSLGSPLRVMAGTLEVILVLPQETDRLQDCLAARTPKVQRLPEYRANTPISTRECSRIAPPDHTTPWGVFGTGFYPVQWPPCSLRT